MNEPEKKDEASAAGAEPQSQAAEQAKAEPKAPPAQDGDPKVEVAKAEATPVLLPTVEQAKAELDVNPARTSVLSKDGHVVRE